MIDETINKYFGPFAEFVSSIVFFSVPMFGTQIPLIVGWLIAAGIFFTFWLKFLGIRGMKHAIDLARHKYDRPNADGEVTHFQALSTALTSTLGLGNIAGVAVAITLGGPGAAFWMVFAGFFAMSTKLAECTLGVKYRRVRQDGSISGGPMYYLRDGLAQIGRPRLGLFLARAWSVCMIIAGLGVMAFQSNQATAQVVASVGSGGFAEFLNANRWAVGLFMAAMGGLVILGGIKAIGRVASGIVPFMTAVYILGCIAVILTNIGMLSTAVSAIFSGAFSPQGIGGGIVGVMIVGFQRAAFSNAAGIGDAAIAHSAVKTDRPSTEGFVAAIEPFFDTVIVNSLSAMAIVITGAYLAPGAMEVGGVALTSMAFETVGSWTQYVLAVAVFLFAFTTILAYSYYGAKGLGFLFGDKRAAENTFKIVLLIFTVIGSSVALGPVIKLADAMLFSMAIFNIIGLYFLAKVIRKEIVGYWDRYKVGEFEADRVDRKKGDPELVGEAGAM